MNADAALAAFAIGALGALTLLLARRVALLEQHAAGIDVILCGHLTDHDREHL